MSASCGTLTVVEDGSGTDPGGGGDDPGGGGDDPGGGGDDPGGGGDPAPSPSPTPSPIPSPGELSRTELALGAVGLAGAVYFVTRDSGSSRRPRRR